MISKNYAAMKPGVPDKRPRITKSDYKFPSETCILACGGPSLNKIDIYETDYPIVACSTAIRKLYHGKRKPFAWISVNKIHKFREDGVYGYEGREAYLDKDILKVHPAFSAMYRGKPRPKPVKWDKPLKATAPGGGVYVQGENAIQVPYEGLRLSTILAVDWLVASGVKNILFAGNDLTAPDFKNKYAFEFDKKWDGRKTKEDKNKGRAPAWDFDRVLLELKHRWLEKPNLKKKGHKWFNYSPGGLLEEFLPNYEGQTL